MNVFERHIQDISNDLSIQPEDRPIFTNDFDRIRDAFLNAMKSVNTVFRAIFGGRNLFGSHIDNLKILKPDEFDVHFLLNLPFNEEIRVTRDNARPGFIKINLKKVMRLMRTDPNSELVYDQFEGFVDDWGFLCRNKLQSWLKDVANDAIDYLGNQIVFSNRDFYNVAYYKRGTAHTIKAKHSSGRMLSIDFVPAFKFLARNEWLADRPFPKNVREQMWLAVPKPTCGPKRTRFRTFSICVPQVEKELITERYNLKSSLRLFKSLKNRMGARVMKSYFIKTIYLHENDEKPITFWQQSSARILIHMIGRLLEYLEEEILPFYWSEEMNLLQNLDEDQISDLLDGFTNAYNILRDYFFQPKIKKSTVQILFDVPPVS